MEIAPLIDQFKVIHLVNAMLVYWDDLLELQDFLTNALVTAGFDKPTYMTNLSGKLDRLMSILDEELEMDEPSRQQVEKCLIETGWVDVNQFQINSLRHLSYLAVAQTGEYEKLVSLTQSHSSDYADCEQFLNQRNKLIEEVILLAKFSGQPFGGVCRDTLKGGLSRIQGGCVPHDVDLFFDSQPSVGFFIQELRHNETYEVSKLSVVSGYSFGGQCETYKVHYKHDTTIGVKVDCVYKKVVFRTPETPLYSIDFNVNALIGELYGHRLLYGVREDLQGVSGLTVSEIASDIEKKQFRAIGIRFNTTPLNHLVFSDKNAHVWADINGEVGRKMRARADALIARGWTLLTTCDDPDCWLNTKK